MADKINDWVEDPKPVQPNDWVEDKPQKSYVSQMLHNIPKSTYGSVIDPMVVSPVKNITQLAGQEAIGMPSAYAGEFSSVMTMADQGKKLKAEILKVQAEPDSELKSTKLAGLTKSYNDLNSSASEMLSKSIINPNSWFHAVGGMVKDVVSMPGAIGQYYKNRYGGWENIKNTAKEDPVGTIIDLSSVLDLGANLTKMESAGVKAISKDFTPKPPPGTYLSPTAERLLTDPTGAGEALQKGSDILSTAARWTNPMTPLGRATSAPRISGNKEAAIQQFKEVNEIKHAAAKLDMINNLGPEANKGVQANLPTTMLVPGPVSRTIDNIATMIAPNSGLAQRVKFTLNNIGDTIENYKLKMGQGPYHISPDITHTETIVDDAYWSVMKDSQKQIEDAIEEIAKDTKGVVDADVLLKNHPKLFNMPEEDEAKMMKAWSELKQSAQEFKDTAVALQIKDVKPKTMKVLNNVASKILAEKVGTLGDEVTLTDLKNAYKELNSLHTLESNKWLQRMSFTLQNKIQSYMMHLMRPEEAKLVSVVQDEALRAVWDQNKTSKVASLMSKNMDPNVQNKLVQYILKSGNEEERKIVAATAMDIWKKDFIKDIKNEKTGALIRREVDPKKLKELLYKAQGTPIYKILSNEDRILLQNLQVISEHAQGLARPTGKVAEALSTIGATIAGVSSIGELTHILSGTEGMSVIDKVAMGAIAYGGVRMAIGMLNTPMFRNWLTTNGYRDAETLLKDRGFLRMTTAPAKTMEQTRKQFYKTPGGFMDIAEQPDAKANILKQAIGDVTKERGQ